MSLSYSYENTSKQRIFADELKYQSTLNFLRPLLEGIAQFAEFDCLTGNSKVVSHPTWISSLMFVGRQNLDEKMLEIFNLGLRQYRTNETFVNRKTDLFYHSLDCNKSPYLAGYLFVKGQHNTIKRKYSEFEDSDFFMNYYKSYLFDDWNLVKILLGTNEHPVFVVEEILEYLMGRISTFLKIDHSNSLYQFQSKILEENGDVYKIENKWISGKIISYPIDSQSNDLHFHQLFNDRISEIFETNNSSLISLAKHLLGFRGTLNLGQSNFNAKVTDKGWLSIKNEHGIPILARQAPPNTELNWEDLVQVDLIYMSDPLSIQTILTKNGKYVTSFSINEVQLDLTQAHSFINRNSVLEAIEFLNKSLDILDKDPEYEICKRYSDELIFANINRMYSHNALLYTDDNILSAALQIMSEDGLYGFLNDDFLVKACAIASLISSQEFDARSDAFTTHWIDGNIEKTLRVINSCFKRHLGFENFTYINEFGYIVSHLL